MKIATVFILTLGLGSIALWWTFHRPAKATGRPSYVVISGDTAGWITPCGCTANQSGGLLRRGTFIRQLRATEDNVIYADVGGAVAGDSAYLRAKFEAVMQGEIEMGLSAHNLGGPEALMGPAYLRDLASRLHAPLISANTRDVSGKSLVEPARVVVAGGRRIALIGVVSPSFATDQVRIDQPKTAILSTLASIRGTYDAVIVLAYVSEQELTELASEIPEADAIIGGHTRQSISPRAIGRVLMGAATNKGKFLIQLDVPPKGSTQRWEGKAVEMNTSFADDQQQLVNLQQFQHLLGEKDFPARR